MNLHDAEKMLGEPAPPNEFRPVAIYDPDTDSLEFLASNQSFYARHLDALVTVYYGQDTNEVVGLLFKKARKSFQELLEHAPGFRTEIENHRIKVEHLFTAKIWSSADDPGDARVVTYRKLREVARKNDVEAQIDALAELAT
jgi:hypothetical protein